MGSAQRQQGAGHLPLEVTTMVGRRQETADIRGLLGSARLVTLTGTGGIGKTRTALHVARAARRTYDDGAWFVELGPVTDPELLAQVVLENLKPPDFSGREPLATLLDYLRNRHLLLVLDNCEHLLGEIARLTSTLLQEVAGVDVLATSRQALGVPGEATYPIEPLPVPAATHRTVPEVAGYAAVELFAARARAALGEFEVDAANQDDVVRLCARLEGLPLALELAAARLKVMTIPELLQRLDDRFGMLKGSSPVGAPRHHTLLAAVTWSHDLCTPAEQVLWRRASVFTGTFDLRAAEQVCTDDLLPRDQVLDALLGLVDKSVVRTERRGKRTRFRMLGTLRDFGAERLAAAGETERCRAGQAAWSAERCATAAAQWCGPRQIAWTRALQREQANIRSALEFYAAHPEHTRTGQQMAGALWFHWVAGEYLSEGRLWLERLLAGEPAPSPERALALGTTAWVAALQGDPARAHDAASECEETAHALGRTDLVAYGLHLQGLAAFLSGRAEEADDLYRRAQVLYSESDADAVWPLMLLVMHGTLHALVGETEAATPMFDRVRRVAEQHQEQWARSYAAWGAGLAHLHAGNLEDAESALLRSIEMKRPFRDVLGLALALDALAWTNAKQGEAASAARLVGAASALWSTFGTVLFGSDFFAAARAECESAARAVLGHEAYDDAVREGAGTPLEQLLGSLLDDGPAQPATRRTDSLLTPREQEVAELVAEGLTNHDIAERLVISQRTAEGHVEHILRKLDFRSRTQIATWFAAREG